MAVAYSGGRDSTALLHATARSARELGLRVLALHVHHGLSRHADDWLLHCRAQCEHWHADGLPVSFLAHRLNGAPAPGQSVEAWAREGRYEALQTLATEQGATLLLLAQHRRDQAETFMLQALRGVGAAGLAAMPAEQTRDGLVWARPWLERPREAIEAYLAEQGLSFIEDDSNADERYARNRLRLAVWPALGNAFPQAEAALAQSAAWAQQALDLQREMAALDLAGLLDDAGLDWAGLRQLSEARASNALRAWLQAELGEAAPASLVKRLLIEAREEGAWPCSDGMLRLYRGRLSFELMAEPPTEARPVIQLDLSRPGLYPQPGWQGSWQVAPSATEGASEDVLRCLNMRERSGGEQFQRGPKGLPRSLKKCFQTEGVPAWRRQGPLLFSGEQLLFVPGLGIDGRSLASGTAPRLQLHWIPDVAP
ncbi:tRNA lysidine(34) synthetase TilS [Pelomonas sp. SE-A7]|uniref:tRNA lysidine(34) synthetase TilS n=1 Tax=Pelomonas sp. SE-A7 TaxID=3054953 RepID=UPI00259C6B19|nr:tRNA lysidine(34) synthetase TilS [Pelomonas sp. SE-A7]MDM4765709.1 tRNA lysidine(34) synthetase TilS [Pelomonas sp. SE-A7]